MGRFNSPEQAANVAYIMRKDADILRALAASEAADRKAAAAIPEGAMRVAPGSDALVWKISPEHSGEL